LVDVEIIAAQKVVKFVSLRLETHSMMANVAANMAAGITN
jgi:hypothetical protein